MTSLGRRHDDSGDYSDASQDIELNSSTNDGGQVETDYGSEGSDSDRDPDSQETDGRRVDDDEDRSNPQYIPKRGTFYEHDDRTAAGGEEKSDSASEDCSEKKEGSEVSSERRRAPRKSDIINKWAHDKYNENEQMPKSRDELVAIYGYDIRNEDAPPHARRNRRYGRGPNKYTRTWEDEEAYKRQTAAAAAPRKPPNPEDFPQLDAANNRNNRKPRTPRPRSKSQPNSNESLGPSENGSLRRNPSLKNAKKPSVKQPTTKPAPSKTSMKPAPKRDPRESREERREVKESREEKKDDREEKKMPPIENLTITASVGNGQGARRVSNVSAVAQQMPVPTALAMKPTQPQQQSNSPLNKPPPQQQPPQQQQKQQQSQQQQQQPAAGGGSKRYSSLRQRPLAENYAPQQQQQNPLQQQQQNQLQQQQQQQSQLQQQQNQLQQQQSLQQQQQQLRYNAANNAAEFPQGAPAPSTQHQQQLIHQVHRGGAPHAASPPHQHPPPHPQQQRLLLEQQQQQMVAHHPLHNMPPQHAIPPHGQLQPTQGYAPPAMMPAQYMQSGSGPVFSGAAIYAAPAAQFTHPQMYQHHNYATSAGGVTYFTCPEQEPAAPPPRAQRRPTAAIPIVKPAHHDRAPNSSEKDNIDRIVENMFVRKPWPANPSADSKEKSQSESRSSQEPSSKDQSQSNSLTSSSISTDSKPSETRDVEENLDENKKEDSPIPYQALPATDIKESLKETQPVYNESTSQPMSQTSQPMIQTSQPMTQASQSISQASQAAQGSSSTQANAESISTDA